MSEDEGGVDGPPDESLFMALGKILLFILVCTALAGQFITGSPLWGYKGKWTNIHTYLKPFKVSRLMINLALDDLACDRLIIYVDPRARRCLQRSN